MKCLGIMPGFNLEWENLKVLLTGDDNLKSTWALKIVSEESMSHSTQIRLILDVMHSYLLFI